MAASITFFYNGEPKILFQEAPLGNNGNNNGTEKKGRHLETYFIALGE
jgi:hypothetical protein